MTDHDADLPTVDLSECENEAIHLLELVQPHGCVLILGGPSLTVQRASLNSGLILGEAVEDLLNRPINTILDGLAVAALEDLLERAGQPETVPVAGFYARSISDVAPVPRLRATPHRIGDADEARLILELEPTTESDEDDAEESFGTEAVAMASLWESENLYVFLDQTVQAIAGLTDYDRVMAYMFHPDWSGEVVAETCTPELTPFLGLRYPASDIPSQARRLYLSNRLRLIADVGAIPVAMTRDVSRTDGAPLDLGHAILRSVSSYHIEYLRNMGVGATLVASLVVDGALWGLIACHHNGPKALPWHRRDAVGRVTSRASDRTADILSLRRDRQNRRAHRFLEMFGSRVVDHATALDALFFGSPRLSDVLHCDGIALHVAGQTAAIGNAPPANAMSVFLERAFQQAQDGVFASHNLPNTGVTDGLDMPACHGALVAFPGDTPDVALACFRDELVHEVHWGGDPNKAVEVDSASNRLSPRKSFNLWRQEVRGQSRPWDPWTLTLIQGCATLLTEHPTTDPDAAHGVEAQTEDLTRGVNTLLSRFEARAESLLEGLDLVDSGTLLTSPRALGGDHDIAVAGNQVFRTQFDLDAGDIEGRPVRDVLRALGLPGTITALPLGASKEVEWWSGEAGHRTLKVLRRGLFSVSRPDETRAWVIYTFEDVTSIYRTQRALGVARQQALARARSRNEFLAQLSRELRDPLQAIQGFADTLDQSPGSAKTDRYRDYAGKIRGLSGNLLDLLNEVLDVTRLEQGVNPSASTVFDLTLLIGEICRMLRDTHHHAGVTWDWHLPNERILVQGDHDALRQAFTTLIAAALRATPEGGTIMIRLIMERGGEPRISISDCGLGLDEDDMMSLTRPVGTPTSQYVGTLEPRRGLGLALARTLIDLHGGTIAVTSNPGSGTTVQATLPRHRIVARDNPYTGD
ncbi:ATP-binding protein [Rhodospira trueperi]|uniref:histidine kinase n=1 Tax=Rhodospira trueperi TaxID=69960 RepID=A0A1G6WGH3_9PROT|nr:ATP-binding protein [Rhodospira trueperi]SDD64921.1 His Kinase A (phospho-acceptor) domain-containing protein [Rhodospira trueperi]